MERTLAERFTATRDHRPISWSLDGVPPEKHQHLYHVSNTMCAIYAEGRDFATYQTTFPSYPNKKFSIRMKAEPLQAS